MYYELDGVKPQPEDQSVWVAPSASVIGNVQLAAHSSIWFNVTARGDNDPITIGKRSNVQDNSVLHTDLGAPLTLGEGVTVGHKVTLHGCLVGDNALIGMGSTILNHAEIGSNSIVGAGSLVTEGKKFGDGLLIVGSPARVIRELKPEELDMLKLSAQAYVDNAARFAQGLKQVTFD